jgi:hypothetical protein
MTPMDPIVSLQSQLDHISNPKTKAWWERYLKYTIHFRGVKMAKIRTAVHDWTENTIKKIV